MNATTNSPHGDLNVIKSVTAVFSLADRERYVDYELSQAPDRMIRLDGFFEDCCENDEGTLTPLEHVMARFKEWARARKELVRARELTPLLERNGYPVQRGVVAFLMLKPVPAPGEGREAAWWWPVARVVKETGFSRGQLQAMRGDGVGPLWRPRGHEIVYHVRSLREWLSGFGAWKDAGSVRSAVAAFLEERCEFASGDWCAMPRADLTEACRRWCVAKFGAVPFGMRRELWSQIQKRGCKYTHRRMGGLQRRTVEGVRALPDSVTL
jgi:hypothetical protein